MATAAPQRKQRQSRPRPLSQRDKQFAQVYVETGDQSQAAKAVGLHQPYKVSGYKKRRQPRLAAYIEELQQKTAAKIAEKTAEVIADKVVLTLAFIDAQLIDIAEHGGGHQYRGEADRVKACELAYRRLGVFDKKGAATFGQQVNVIAGASPGAPQLTAGMYMPKWVRDQLGIECATDAAIEAKLLRAQSSPAPLATEDDATG